MPQPGQRVTVSYRPSALLSGQPRLTLRARLRAPGGKSYNSGVPVITVATLRPGDGGTFTGAFALPDSVVYGAFAVEDSSASVIDDNGSRAWELLVSDSSGRPAFAALDQRASDMMGRNWEEGYATVQRMVALYPDTLRGWIWLRAFHSWLGRSDDDSIRTLHRTRLAAFDAEFSTTPPTTDEEGLLAWYAQGTDSSIAARWRARLIREAPTNSFAVQWRLLSVFDSLRTSHDTVRARRQVDALWAQAPRERRAQVAEAGTGLAFESGDMTLIRRWTTRLSQSEDDARASARRTALNFTRLASLRGEGIARLRAEIDSLVKLAPEDRALDETLADQRARHDRLRRQTMATLGQALVADGRPAEARTVLEEATSIGWNLGVFTTVRSASLLAGDTSSALTMAARMIADPRTPAAFAASVHPVAVRHLGEAAWQRELDSARALFVERMLAGASARTLARKVRVRGLGGRTESIAGLTQGRVSVVVFWSRFCGPAIQELPHLNEVAARLARDGIPVVSIVDEPTTSPALKAFLKDKQVTVPVYLDSWHEASRAFNQWGTPYYYVVDDAGRVRFDVTLSADEALAQAEALRLATRVESTSARR
ncbi:MAG TPA: redoxin domain-containing protein [Gemmatimonadaceae bacterium]|nr:redoxin domain-containing protein [Gemmatimonadaceae bacterium]